LAYPEFVEINYLEEYSKQFDTVEIDQCFWSLYNDKVVLPKASVVNEYNVATPKDFKFTIKVPNSLTLTHPYKSNTPNKYFLSNETVPIIIPIYLFVKKFR